MGEEKELQIKAKEIIYEAPENDYCEHRKTCAFRLICNVMGIGKECPLDQLI